MKSDWVEYPRGRKARFLSERVLVVPESYVPNNHMALFCEVCELRYRSSEDEKTYKEFGCCVSCADTWAYSMKEEWSKGWRPSKEQIDLSVERRSFASATLLFEQESHI